MLTHSFYSKNIKLHSFHNKTNVGILYMKSFIRTFEWNTGFWKILPGHNHWGSFLLPTFQCMLMGKSGKPWGGKMLQTDLKMGEESRQAFYAPRSLHEFSCSACSSALQNILPAPVCAHVRRLLTKMGLITLSPQGVRMMRWDELA